MTTSTRRDQRRVETHAEIVRRAADQVDSGGAQTLSLNAVAREMGMSGPAIYRYFPAREDLLAALVVTGYADLTAALVAATSIPRRPPTRLRAAAAAYRQWGLDHPHRYRLMFGDPHGSGHIAPETVVPASQQAMLVILDLVDRLPTAPAPPALRRQLHDWGATRGGGDRDPGALFAGVRLWTRLHGVVSLEIEGAFASMGLDAGALVDAEVDALLAGAAAT